MFSSKLRRREIPWEVVNSEAVEAVPTFSEDEDLDIGAIGESDVQGTYVFEVNHPNADIRKLIVFARRQLMQEIYKKGYNVLLVEGWRTTTYRRGKQYRIEVQYRGRPARGLGKLPESPPPPFMDVLHVPHY